MKDTIESGELLVDGAMAFDEILRCIDAANTSISINMFIWRNDVIGNRLAEALLRAADRGVSVNISVDRVGMILELCEESESSFFHTSPSLSERLKISVLRRCYPKNRSPQRMAIDCSELRNRILSHPHISVDRDRKKNDHSKFYIIDDRILIFGGINVEDKECGSDSAGRVYQDYMIKLEGAEHVRAFLDKLWENRDSSEKYRFRMNNKTVTPPTFEMYDSFLSVINGAEEELVIVMAYFAPIRSIVRAIVSAWRRGVRIRIMIPGDANFQNNSNRKTVRRLMKLCQNGIELRFSPKMVHTKLILSEKRVMLGSSNITNRAFSQLGEVDIELECEDTPLVEGIKESVEENLSISEKIDDYRKIKYSRLVAWIEGISN